MTKRHFPPRRGQRAVRFALGLAAAGVSTAALAGPRDGTASDEIWRQIFRREDQAPAGLAEPVAAARAALGQRLFADTRLSGASDRSCASCHDPASGFVDGRVRARARDGGALARNVPHLYNLAWAKALFWDGRAASLEAQARVPIEDEREMAGNLDQAAERLTAEPAMVDAFAAAFPGARAITAESILAALAAYERTLVSPTTRFDRWVAGEDAALSDEERAGLRLFTGKGGCVACHGGWRLTDDDFHDTGVKSPDPGRGAVAGGVPGLSAFKTPGLRELSRTAPYMHDGSLSTLAAVLDHYAGGLERRPGLSSSLPRALSLSESEKADLLAFLATLSSEPSPLHNTDAPNGRKALPGAIAR